jgi:hypothetical protein
MDESEASKGDLIAMAMRGLENPDTPPQDRVAFALYVAAGGESDRPVTFGQVAELAGLSATDVRQALFAMRERGELR